jgi:UDP-N-acetylmuramate dehydrogenase
MEKETIAEKVARLDVKLKLNEPLARYTTLRIGGPARFYIEPYNLSGLCGALKISRESKLPIFVIGAGSNLLIGDKGMDGIVIRLKKAFDNLDFNDNCIAGAGVMWQYLIKRTVDMGYSGFEAMAGIPGTVGGLVVMNAGTSEEKISDRLIEVKTVDFEGNIHIHRKADIKFGYRSSSLEGLIVIEAKFKLKKESRDVIIKQINESLSRRSKSQPLSTLNAGSIFKNPAGGYAAEYIEKCGLKGYSIGGAAVSSKHANFIINTGEATAEDVYKLIFEIRRKVHEQFDIKLELEIKLLGF